MNDQKDNFMFWGLSASTINHVRIVIEKRINDYQNRIDAYKELLDDIDKESSKYAQFQKENKKDD